MNYEDASVFMNNKAFVKKLDNMVCISKLYIGGIKRYE